MTKATDETEPISDTALTEARVGLDEPKNTACARSKTIFARPTRRIDRGHLQDRVIATRFPRSEAERIKEMADEHGLTVSSLIRNRVFGLQIRSKIDSQAVNELRRQGGLLKQWITACREQNIDFDHALAEEAIRQMIAAAKKISGES